MMTRQRGDTGLALGLSLLAVHAAAAADLHHYMPADTKVIAQVHVRRMFNAPLVDRDKAITWGGLIRKEVNDPQVLTIKPLDDVREALIAMPSVGEIRKAFVALEGKFDSMAIRDRITRDFKDSFKEEAQGATTIWSFRVPSQKLHNVTTPEQIFLAVPDPMICLVSLGCKDDLTAALSERPAGTPRELRALLDRADKEDVFRCVLTGPLEGPYANIKQAKKAFDQLQSMQGGIQIDEEVRGQFTLTSESPAAAREAAKAVRAGFNGLTGIVALLSQKRRDLLPIFEVLRTLKITVRDNLIIIRGKLERDVLEELIKMGKAPG
jgi:hypothetical protein